MVNFATEFGNFKAELKKAKKGISFSLPLDLSLIGKAINLGYDDAKRTFKGIGKSPTSKTTAFYNLAKAIEAFFNANPVVTWIDYYNLHKGWCDKLISDLAPFKVTHGQAQKIINMAMKYIFCLSSTHRNHFDFCHMALDSYILAWYNRQKIGKTKTSWSKLDDKEYREIQEKIYGYLNGGRGQYTKREIGKKKKLSKEFIPLGRKPIEEEFVVWACETKYPKLVDAYETINSIIGGTIDLDILTQKDEADFRALKAKPW